MRPPRRFRKPHTQGDLRAVVDETIALFRRLEWVAAQIYGDDGRSAARRGILRGLARFGPQTVPRLARARAVTRQNVQPIVDALAASGLVSLAANPAHARSPLVAITEEGAALVRAWDAIDARVLAAAGRGISAADLAVAARTLRALRTRFESEPRWRSAL